jgi:hypothetical protein
MGILQDFGVVRKKEAPMMKSYQPFRKNTTTDLKQMAKSLKQTDRAKFFGILKKEGRWGETSSNKQILDTLKKRGEDRIFRERIKDKVLTSYSQPGMSKEQIERNVRLSTFDRIREESQAKFGQGSQYQKESSLAGDYGKKDVGATAKRPGATRQERQYDKGDIKKPDIHLPI